MLVFLKSINTGFFLFAFPLSAAAGGLMSLCFGLSILSAAEIFYFFMFRSVLDLFQWKKKAKKNEINHWRMMKKILNNLNELLIFSKSFSKNIIEEKLSQHSFFLNMEYFCPLNTKCGYSPWLVQ